MVHPKDKQKLVNFNRTRRELEEFLLFCIVVAGKTAKVQDQKLDQFLKLLEAAHEERGRNEGWYKPQATYFDMLFRIDPMDLLKRVKMGQYRRIYRGFKEVIWLDPETATLEEIEAVPGIGPKSARFFILYSRPNQRVAVLDTHIMKYLRSTGLASDKDLPHGSTYKRLEQAFLELCDRRQISPIDLDFEIWLSQAR